MKSTKAKIKNKIDQFNSLIDIAKKISKEEDVWIENIQNGKKCNRKDKKEHKQDIVYGEWL